MSWDSTNIVFMDFETQSACDINEKGGRLYAYHPSTRILIMVVNSNDVYHIWIPDHIRCNIPTYAKLWPRQFKNEKLVQLYRGSTCPEPIVECMSKYPVVAHNAYGFDKHICDHLLPQIQVEWLDSLYLARAAGRAGKLDLLGKQILGQGKDKAKKLLPKLTTAKPSLDGLTYSYPMIVPGDLQIFATYAIADVELIVQLWREFDDLYVEADLIDLHNRMNDRGVGIDKHLLYHIEKLSRYSQSQAIHEIENLTAGRINANNIRSTKQIHEWLASYGVDIVDPDTGTPCLRKEIVQRYLDSPYLLGGIDDRGVSHDTGVIAAREIPTVVLDVLRLRMHALRITDAKVSRAIERVSEDGRIRDLLGYHVAHTGRFSSSGVQVHNLPRPLPGIDIEKITKMLEETPVHSDVASTFDLIKSILPSSISPKIPRIPTMDDVCSALIRPSFVPSKGCLFGICDYSSIEARMVAWLAREEKLLETFRNNEDIYTRMASVIYGVAPEYITHEQRQVGKITILGSGYGMSANKFRVFAANSGVDLARAGITADQCIELYRSTYIEICGVKPDANKNYRTNGLWHKYDNAVKAVVSGRIPEDSVGRCHFRMQGHTLVCTLPSGRELWYNDAKIEDIIPPYAYTMNLPLVPKATVTYQGHYGRKSLYGGLITENISQAACRDIMVDALLAFDRIKWCPVLTVHDEILVEFPISEAEDSLYRMVEIMSTPPDWCHDFPLACEGFLSPRFVKKPFKGYRALSTSDLAQKINSKNPEK